MVYSRFRSRGKFIHPTIVVNGILGALVTSSPTCASVHTKDPLIIGALGSLFTNFINETVVKEWLLLDDPVGALGVHLGGGLWGCIAVGLFADARLPGLDLDVSGAFRGGGFELMGRQMIGILAISGWSLVTMPPFFYLLGVAFSWDWKDPRKGLRHEYIQMDRNLHGCTEDPTDKINEEIMKALQVLEEHSDRISSSALRISHAGILTGTTNLRRSYVNNLSTGNRQLEDDNVSVDSTTKISEEEEEQSQQQVEEDEEEI